MTRSTQEKRTAFRALHAHGCFKLPNPWDAGSARLLQSLGFEALASTSSGFAWTTGRPDYGMELEDVLRHLTVLCGAVDVPVNADFEAGFAEDASGVALNVTRAIETGVAGLSIEDRDLQTPGALYDLDVAVERVRAARLAIDASGHDVILVGRTEGLLIGGTVPAAIDTLVALADAGADCLYGPGFGMPGLSTKEDVATLVRAVAPKPVNVLVVGPGISLREFEDMGVRRISLGGALSLVGWAAVMEAATRFKRGQLDGLSTAMPSRALNSSFETFA